MSRPESPLNAGDKLTATRQSDGSYNAVARLVAPDGSILTRVANVSNPDTWARVMRYSVSNPPVHDPTDEIESLVDQRGVIETRMVELNRADLVTERTIEVTR